MESAQRRRPGRPANTIHGSIAARHRSGAALGWSDGIYAGSPALVARARALVADNALLALPGGAWVIVDTRSPLAAYAVLLDLCGPDAAVYGDVPVEDLAALTAVALQDPDAGEPNV